MSIISKLKKIKPYQAKELLLRSVWVFFLFSLFRLIFNFIYFDTFIIADYWYGLLFDLSSFSQLFAVFLFFSIAPFSFVYKQRFQIVVKWFYLFGVFLLVSLNGIDLVYFSFTSKRLTTDVFSFLTLGGDLFRLIPAFLFDYWYSFLAVVFLLFISAKIFSIQLSNKEAVVSLKKQAVYTLMLLLFIPFASRGGFQYKPISLINATKYTSNPAIVLNSSFTFFTTLFEGKVKLSEYYDSLKESEAIYSPIKVIKGIRGAKKKNLVIIILESFSKEYIGGYNKGKPTYTPFLDSLMNHSVVFDSAFANGKTSIEAVPAVLAGIPTWMSNAYIYSPFAGNKINSLATSLKKAGYSSSFYHGGHNGTMGFDAFCSSAGVEDYVGMNEHPNKDDFDGNWGIFDEPFLQKMCKDLSAKKEPFFSSVFTLSSHHPYGIPKAYENMFPKGTLAIHESIGYTDYALKKFFEKASKESWFENTVFVITADHTAQNFDPDYKNRKGNYSIPLLVFEKNNKPERKSKMVQQIDIYPSMLKYLNVSDSIISYGNDVFSENEMGYNMVFTGSSFQYLEGNDIYILDDNYKTVHPVGLTKKKPIKHNIGEAKIKKVDSRVKAMIDSYSKRMRRNKMSIE